MDIAGRVEERLAEIVEYVDFVGTVNRRLQAGEGKVGDEFVTERHQKMLYSSVYLQIYNMVEATISACVEAVAEATVGTCRPGELSPHLRREWVKQFACTHKEMNPDTRLQRVTALLDFIVSANRLEKWTPAGAGGNWDDQTIEDMAARMGFELPIEPEVLRGVKRRVRDDKGLLRLVRDLRNQLAHGSVSFVDCAGDVTLEELGAYAAAAGAYLRQVVHAFEAGIRRGSHLASPPDAAAAVPR